MVTEFCNAVKYYFWVSDSNILFISTVNCLHAVAVFRGKANRRNITLDLSKNAEAEEIFE